MKKNRRSPRDWGFYFITDRKMAKKPVIETVKDAIAGGASVVQYREKELSREQMIFEAKKICELCKQSNVVFIVNDYPDIALEVGADGVHVGQSDAPYAEARKMLGKDCIIGISATNVQEAIKAASQGADYIGLGPIYITATKVDAAKPIGLEVVKLVSARTNIPIVAIGGINLDNAADIIRSGAVSVCAISATVSCEDISGEVKKFNRLIEGLKRPKHY